MLSTTLQLGLYATSVLKADYVERNYDETLFAPAQCKSLEYKVECHLSTAFVTATSQWLVPGTLLKAGCGRARTPKHGVLQRPNV